MVTRGTTFPYKQTHSATWRSPGGPINNPIDHILIDARHKNNTMYSRTYTGANIDCDSYLVVTRIR
jgi:hypothetical protein